MVGGLVQIAVQADHLGTDKTKMVW
jgi:hypothetical protein